MELSLPISAAAKPQTRSKAAAALPLGRHAPSVALPLMFVLTGLSSLFCGIVWLVAQPALLAQYHYNQSVVAATHLFVLGWLCSVVMGAMYQLVPVALETKLYSENLARVQFVFHLTGFVGMVWMFRVWNMKQVGHFGSVLAVGVVLFVYNIGRTLRRVPKWNIVATSLAAALFWISFTVLAGLSIVVGKCSYDSIEGVPAVQGANSFLAGLRALARFVSHFDAMSAMHSHAHLGGVGFFTMLILGVSFKLIPMFTLSEVQSKRRAALSVLLLNVGLAGSFASILLRSRWKLGFALIVVGALAVYVRELAAILKARKRRKLDWGIKYFLTAVGCLLPLSAMSLVLSWPGLPLTVFTGQLENVYGFLGFIGVVTFAIMGMLYKIIPFLVWFGRYSSYIGRAGVPSLADLYSAPLQAAGYWSYLLGLGVTCVGILNSNETGVRSGCLLILASIATLAANVVQMLTHFFKPRLTALGSSQ